MMAHAEKCPVCNGTGKYLLEPDNREIACYGCDGKGWIEVADSPYYTIQPIDWRAEMRCGGSDVPMGGFHDW